MSYSGLCSVGVLMIASTKDAKDLIRQLLQVQPQDSRDVVCMMGENNKSQTFRDMRHQPASSCVVSSSAVHLLMDSLCLSDRVT
eukprot:2774450-Amphidinium_carterae.1